MEAEMRYILEVYRQGSFSKAAEALFMTQAALSLAVKRVEGSLGAEIFDRSRRPLRLTQAGEIYLETIREMEHLEGTLERKIMELKELERGRMRLGGTHYLNAHVLPGALSGFSWEHPGIELEIVEASSARLAEAIANRDLDLTFLSDQAILSEYPHRGVFYDHVLLAVPRSFSLPEKVREMGYQAEDILLGRHLVEERRLNLSEFQDLPFLLLSPGNNLYARSQVMFAEAHFQPKVKTTLDQLDTAYALASHGFGATFVSDREVDEKSKELLFFCPDSDQTVRGFYGVLPKQNYIPHAVEAFLSYVTKKIQEEDQARGWNFGVPGKETVKKTK